MIHRELQPRTSFAKATEVTIARMAPMQEKSFLTLISLITTDYH